MILTKDNIVLVDNEIYLLKESNLPKCEGILDGAICITRPVLASTNHSLEGVKHLDRNLFVKKLDVEAREYALAQGENARNYAVAHDFISGRGKYEFTREEARALFNEGCRQGTGEYPQRTFDECVNILRPLSIPESIELDDEFNVVNVKW